MEHESQGELVDEVLAESADADSQTHNSSQSTTSAPSKRSRNKIAFIVLGVALVVSLGIIANKVLVVATVNGSPIFRFSVIDSLEKKGGQQVVDALVIEKLVKTAISSEHIVVTEAEIDTEIATIRDAVTKGGSTLEVALQKEGMTLPELREQRRIQKALEQKFASKVTVTPEEVEKYILDNKITLTPDQAESARTQIATSIKNEKASAEISAWITELKAKAKVVSHVSYYTYDLASLGAN